MKCTGFAVFDPFVPCGPFVTLFEFQISCTLKTVDLMLAETSQRSLTITRSTAQDVKDDDLSSRKSLRKTKFSQPKTNNSRITHI